MGEKPGEKTDEELDRAKGKSCTEDGRVDKWLWKLVAAKYYMWAQHKVSRMLGKAWEQRTMKEKIDMFKLGGKKKKRTTNKMY